MNYYPCESNNIANCDKCLTKDKCYECKNDYITANEGNNCISHLDIEKKLYYNDPEGSNNYFLCSTSLNNCLECESKTICTKCESDEFEIEETGKCISKSDIEAQLYYKDSSNNYVSCSKILNCEKCSSADNCISCKSGYDFIEGDDNIITCQNNDKSTYYPKTTNDGKTYYRKCQKDIINCNKCTNENRCTECNSNYAIIDDNYSECQDLSGGKYYYDNNLQKYKLCSFKYPNCEKCLVENNNIICKECSSRFAFKHDNSVECTEESILKTLQNNKMFFSNDSGINYYSCSLYNLVDNCSKCTNKDTCEECINGFDLYNENKLCAKKTDVDSNLYTLNGEGILLSCSSLITDCKRCNDSSTCYECRNESALINNNTCVSKTLVEDNDNYFKDIVSNKYISCSIIDNCITCISSKQCTSCQKGYAINNNICQEIISEDNDNKLSTGAIIGIIIGCLGFAIIAALVIYYLVTKVFSKDNEIFNENVITTGGDRIDKVSENEDNKENIEDKEIENQLEQNKIVVHNTKRSIHNK